MDNVKNGLEDDSSRASQSDIMRSAREEFEIKSSVGQAGETFGIILTSVLVSMMILGFVFFIRAFWVFVHPNFEFSLPKLPSLALVTSGQQGDAPKRNPNSSASPLPNVTPTAKSYSSDSISAYLNRLESRGNELTAALTMQERLDLGVQVCDGIKNGFTKDEILTDFKRAVAFKFPGISGVKDMSVDVFESASRNLCPISRVAS